MPAPVRLLYGFFCEYCRLEASGQVTALGLWGSECRLATNGPVMMPSLGFHAFVSNPDQVPLTGTATFSIPGLGQTPIIPVELTRSEGMSGHNIILSVGNVPIPSPGTISVRLQLNSEPPIDQEFILEIRFAPPPAK